MARFIADGAYPPDPWNTTWLPQHYPEHHHLFEHTRHAIGHALSGLAHEILIQPAEQLITPRTNAYESLSTFYLDVELPGVRSTDEVELEWLTSGTLLLKTKPKKDPHEPLRTEETKKAEEEAAKAKAKADAEAKAKGEQPPMVYMTVHERKIGAYGRAYHFPVKVDREKMRMELEAGVLSMELPKKEVSPPPKPEEHKKHVDTWATLPIAVI